jgi:hypothetical protein
MSIGPGLIEGTRTGGVLYGFRPGDDYYVDSTGLVYHPQDENGTGNIPFYEVTAQGDSVEFRVPQVVRDYSNTALSFNTVFGPTDYTLEDASSGNNIVEELSGYGSNVWNVEVARPGATLRITDFGDTTAALYPFFTVSEVQ